MHLHAVLRGRVARRRAIVAASRRGANTIISLYYSTFDSIDHAFGQSERCHVSCQAARAAPAGYHGPTTLKVLLSRLDDGFVDEAGAALSARRFPSTRRRGGKI